MEIDNPKILFYSYLRQRKYSPYYTYTDDELKDHFKWRLSYYNERIESIISFYKEYPEAEIVSLEDLGLTEKLIKQYYYQQLLYDIRRDGAKKQLLWLASYEKIPDMIGWLFWILVVIATVLFTIRVSQGESFWGIIIAALIYMLPLAIIGVFILLGLTSLLVKGVSALLFKIKNKNEIRENDYVGQRIKMIIDQQKRYKAMMKSETSNEVSPD